MNPSVRTEPWGKAPADEATSRLLVELPDLAGMRVELRDPSTDVSPLRRQQRTAAGGELWELSRWFAPAAAERRLELRVDGKAKDLVFPAFVTAGMADPATGAEPVDPAWERLLQHHLEQVSTWTEDRRADADVTDAGGVTQAPWRPYLDGYWSDEDDEQDRAPRQLIVRIARQCARWTKALCDRPRRILRREREGLALAKVQDVDAQCLRWLIRQPGRTLAERAGSRQRILAVVRTESFDTLENRVLRDFLTLSMRAGARYVRDFGGFTESKRVKDVQAWNRMAAALLLHSPIAGVPGLAGVAERNYVLQYDARYVELWRWYDRLRRQENDRESLVPWQHRMWHEYVELAVWQACAGLAPASGAHGTPVLLRHEADHGRFLDARTRLGPWTVGSGDAARVVRLLRSDEFGRETGKPARVLAGLGADAALAVGRPFADPAQQTLVGIWALFEPGVDDERCRRRVRRLDEALHSADATTPPPRGLLVLPSPDHPRAIDGVGNRAVGLRLPVPGETPNAKIVHAIGVVVRALCGIGGGR
jgi:hypothetical protein